MTEKKSILLSDVSIQGNLTEKEKIIIDGKINGNVSAEEVEAHENSEIVGNISTKNSSLGGKVKGNINSEKIKLKSTCDIEGTLTQKTLSIEEGAILKVKTETYK